MTIFYVIISLVLGLGLLILVHELGHFMVARWAGVRVEAFSIGFGRALWKWKRGDTEYKISILPLGGYVRMAGQDDLEIEELKDDPESYQNKPVHKRMAIILAGPIMNLILACVIMPMTFWIGRERPAFEMQLPEVQQVRAHASAAVAGMEPGDLIVRIGDREVATWEAVQEAIILTGKGRLDMEVERGGSRKAMTLERNRWGLGFHPASFIMNRPVVHSVTEESPAQRAGLQAGDRVLAVGGYPIGYWDELTLMMGKGRSLWFWMWAAREWGGNMRNVRSYLTGGPITMLVRSDSGAERTLQIDPEYSPERERYLVGIRHDPEIAYADVPKTIQKYGFIAGFVRGQQENWRLLRVTGQFLARLIKAPEQHYESLGGPVRIISMFAKIAQEGLSPFLYFMAFFSMQLGILNLLPIPVLDGGHVVFLTIEAIRRKPLTIRVQAVAQQIGLCLLLSIFVIVTINDLGHFEWVKRLMRSLF